MMTKSYKTFCREAATGAMVLLHNKNGALPLRICEPIALLGRGQFVTFKSGFGSGDVVGVKTVCALEGLEQAGIPISKDMLAYNRRWHYDHFDKVKNADKFYDGMENLDEIPLTEAVVQKAAKEAQTAVVILGRVTGECRDVELKKGDYYLSDQEQEMLRLARAHFAKVVVCLNYGGVYDLQGVLSHSPDAVLYMSQGGQQVGNALADVLLGKVTPSGKLADTWAKDYDDYPSKEHFGEMVVPYKEGIYVGYRYFDTFGRSPLYPFGYGLSYTDFQITCDSTCLEGSVFKARATVKNVGSVSGREVLQCYLSKPDGGLEQAYQELAAFAKTRLLAPGEEESISLSFDFCEQASYDSGQASFVLPGGAYHIRLGNSSRSTHIIGCVEIKEAIPVLKTVNRFPASLAFEEISAKGVAPYTYPGEEAEKTAAKRYYLRKEDIPYREIAPAEAFPPQKLTVRAENHNRLITMEDVASGTASAEDLVAQFTQEELACIINGINYGQETYDGGIIGNMADTVPGAAGETFTMPKYGILGNVCADGPAGIRLLSSGDDFTKIAEDDKRRTLTAYPIGTGFANSWDVELAREYGECIAEELAEFSLDGWLAPGMNIHRNPLCGRNFEYYSEDPLLSGKMAAAVTAGVQTKDGKSTGKYTTVKHFAANNQETLRTEMSSEVSERALREIYLKGFEIAVKEAQPHALMTAYNRLNGVYPTVNFDLLNGVLRSEWDFQGIVMSDWGAHGALAQRPAAGNDLNMPGSGKSCIELLRTGEMDVASLQACAVRIVKWLVKTTGMRLPNHK